MHLYSELHIYHTSDTHGHLTSDSYIDDKSLPKGLARVSNYFKTQNHQNQIKIDLGDTLQGSPLAYIFKEEKKPSFNPFASTLNLIKYDYFVPGNHDFNYGLTHLNTMVECLDAKTLCSNIFFNENLYFKAAYDVKYFDHGLKVAIIGITNNYVPNWESEENIKGLRFENAYESAKRIVLEIKEKEKVDYIIVAYHGGYECHLETGENESKNSDENLGCKIFTQIKEVDLLLTGHEHRLLTLYDNKRVMLQPGYGASHVSHTTISFVKENDWIIDKVHAELVSMNDYVDDKEVLDMLNPFIINAKQKMKEVIGHTNLNLKITDPFLDRLYKNPIFQYINEVQMKTTGAMISCCGLGNDITGFNETITLGDVINTYVFPNTLYLVEITGKTLIEALTHQACFFTLDDQKNIKINPSYLYPKKELYNYDVFDGIHYDIVVGNSNDNDVENVIYKGHKVKDSDKFTLVLNSYRMSGGGNITWHKDLKVIQAFPLDITEILITEIKKTKEIKMDIIDNIKIIKK